MSVAPGIVWLAALAVGCSAPRPAPSSMRSFEVEAMFRVSAEGQRSDSTRVAPTAVLRDEASSGLELPLTRWAGTEVRVYPAGVIATAYGEVPQNEHDVIILGVGGNWTDRHDYGEHDREDGSGFGGGLGFRRYFGEHLDGWFLGGRLEVWALDIDWKDRPNKPKEKRGSSDVIMLQPTADLGYAFRLDERWRLSVFGSIGMEINVYTSGENVGDGPIGLVGLSLVYGF